MIENVANADVTLLLPGLLAGDHQPQQLGNCQAISRIAAAASKSQVATASLESAALNWFHGSNDPLPNCAALTGYRLDYPEATVTPHCLRADPVFQQLDINEAILADRSVLDIQMSEALAIIEDLNRHFQDDGVAFSCVSPDRWYCQFPYSLDVQTIPPGAATGRSVSLTMSRGGDAGVWRAWLSEIEMLLYSHPINQQRASMGKNVINSLWLWGEGDPAVIASPFSARSSAKVYSDQFYAMSLAHHLDVEYLALAQFSANTQFEDVLLVDDRLSSAFATGDVNQYEATLMHLESDVFMALERQCRRNSTLSISIWGGDDQWLRVSAKAVAGGWLSRLLDKLPWISTGNRGGT